MIKTPRFLLRPLTVSDVSERYLSWLSEDAALRFIIAAGEERGLEQLREYVARRQKRDDVLFLGIFNLDGEHIGNVKYEPIDRELRSTVMGILIGELSWRGKGVAGEVIHASAQWLNRHSGIRSIVLGVDVDNLPAIAAYRKIGFIEKKTTLILNPESHLCTMVWNLEGSEDRIY